jgi:hypothetical protein
MLFAVYSENHEESLWAIGELQDVESGSADTYHYSIKG